MLPPRPRWPLPGLRASSREGLRWRPPSCRYLDHVLATEDAARDVGSRGRREGRRGVRRALAAPPSERRKQSVTKAPPEEPRSRRRIPRLRKHATNLLWALLAAAVPWVWFLVRDLGSVTQLIALAIPVLVAAAFVGLAISLLDERRLSTLIVAVSVAAFGWVTIFGPRAATPAPRTRRAHADRVDGGRRHEGRRGRRLEVRRRTEGRPPGRGRAVEEGPQRAGANGSLSVHPDERPCGRAVIRSRARAAAPQAAAVGPHRSAAGGPPGGCVHRVRRPRRGLAPRNRR